MLSIRKTDNPNEVAVTVTTKTFIRLALLSVATLVLIVSVRRASHALMLIFIALFLAIALNNPVHYLGGKIPGKKRGDRVLATSLSFLLVIVLLIAFIASIAPPLIRQTGNFADAAPRLVRDFRSQDSQTGRFIREHNLEKQINGFSEQLSDRLQNIGGSAFTSVQRIGNSAFSLLTIIVLTFMMLVEGPRWLRFFREIVPRSHLSMSNRIAEQMYGVIRGYVNGQVALAALAAIMIMPAILFLGIGYPVALMVIIFFCGLIPMVGHTIGALIITIVALFESTSAAIIILAYYILYQQIENIFIQPRVQANSTNMSPLLVFSSVVIGVSFGGLIGGLLAIPVAGCVRVLILEYLHEQKIISQSLYKNAITPETK